MMQILLVVSSPGATGSYLLLLRFKPTKLRVLLRSASAKHAVLSYGLVGNGNSAFGLYSTHEFFSSTGERGNAVGTGKPGRVAVIVGNPGGWSPRSVKVWDDDVRSRKKQIMLQDESWYC